jgi:hypothetical protein
MFRSRQARSSVLRENRPFNDFNVAAAALGTIAGSRIWTIASNQGPRHSIEAVACPHFEGCLTASVPGNFLLDKYLPHATQRDFGSANETTNDASQLRSPNQHHPSMITKPSAQLYPKLVQRLLVNRQNRFASINVDAAANSDDRVGNVQDPIDVGALHSAQANSLVYNLGETYFDYHGKFAGS